MCLIIALFIVALLFAAYFLLVLVGTAFALVPWLIVGLIAGWAASAITESRHGILGDILIGLAGSFIGGVLYVALFHHRAFGLAYLLAAIVGSVILLLVVKAVRGQA